MKHQVLIIAAGLLFAAGCKEKTAPDTATPEPAAAPAAPAEPEAPEAPDAGGDDMDESVADSMEGDEEEGEDEE